MIGEKIANLGSQRAARPVKADRQGEVRQGDRYLVAVAFSQAGRDPSSQELVKGGIVPQTARALDNIQAVLSDAAGEMGVYQVDVQLAREADFPAFNKAYMGSNLIKAQNVLPTRFTYLMGEQEQEKVPGALVTISANAAFRKKAVVEPMNPLMRPLNPSGASAAVPAYSPGVIIYGGDSNRLVMSGQIALKPEGGIVEGGIVAETENVRDRLHTLLEAGGATPRHIDAVDVVTPDRGNLGAIGKVLKDWGVPSTVSPKYTEAGLLLGAGVEMRVEAEVPKKKTTVIDLGRRL